MVRKPEPLTVKVIIDDSPEARARYIAALQIIIRRIYASRVEAAQDLVEAERLRA